MACYNFLSSGPAMIFLNLLVLFIPLSKPPLLNRLYFSGNFGLIFLLFHLDLAIPGKGPRISHNCTILSSQVLDNFVLADELFPKLYEALKLVSQLMIIYMEN